MRKYVAILTLVFVLALVAPAALGTTYYVSTAGSDTNSGLAGSPWATLQKAVNTVVAGDTVIVRSGTYTGFRITDKGGTPAAPITLQSETKGAANVNVVGSVMHGSMMEFESTYGAGIGYWIIDGFSVDGTAQPHSAYRCGIDMRGMTNMTVRNCTVHDCYKTGIFPAYCDYAVIENNTSRNNGEHGIYDCNSSDYGVNRSNVCYGNVSNGIQCNADVTGGGDGIMTGWLLERNKLYNDANGFNLPGLVYSTFRSNLIYDVTSKGFSIYGGEGALCANNLRILNNTLVMKSTAYYAIFMLDDKDPGPVGMRIFNNIIYHYGDASGRGMICPATRSFTDIQSDYNCVGNWFGVDDNATTLTLAQWRSTYGLDTHSIQAADTALWVSPSTKDFHLKSTSPARDHGTTLTDVPDDFAGMSRPQNGVYDIGCYEYVVEGIHPVSVLTTSLPNCDQGLSYITTLAAGGGVTPYTWSIISGHLPNGFVLGASSGMITGTPGSPGSYTFTVRVTDSNTPNAHADQELTLLVTNTRHVTLQDDNNGYSGTQDTWLNSDYPNDTNGSSDCTHLQYPTQDRQLHKWDLSLISTDVTINSATVSLSIRNIQYGSGTIGCYRVTRHWEEMEASYTHATASTTWGTPGMQAGTDYVATPLASIPLTSAGWLSCDITSTVEGWLAGTFPNEGVMHKATSTTDLWARVWTRECSPNGQDHPKLEIAYTPAGGIPAFEITTTSLSNGHVGLAYSRTLGATGGASPYTWTLSAGTLPAGLSMSSAGRISGTPTAEGTANFTVQVADDQSPAETATQALSITVVPTALEITTVSLPQAQLNVSYGAMLSAIGGQMPYSWSLAGGGLPAGLSLTATGQISGTPTATGVSSFTVRVTDGAPATVDKTFSIYVGATPSGNVYYVATTGNDAWPGSAAQPWATLLHAVNTIAAGDTVIVKPGHYAGFRVTDKTGTSSTPFTIKSETPGLAIIDTIGNSGHGGMIEFEGYAPNEGYWIVDGFDVDGRVEASSGNGVDVRGMTNMTIRNCSVHNAWGQGIFSAFADYMLVENNETRDTRVQHGIYLSNSGDYGVTRGNITHDNAQNGIQCNADVGMGGDGVMSFYIHEKNKIYNNINGYNLPGLCDSTIRNCLMYDIRSKGFSMYTGEAAEAASRDHLYNNTIVMPVGAYFAIFMNNDKSDTPIGNRIFNNILYHYGDSQQKGIICVPTPTLADLQSDYNVVGNWFGIDDCNTATPQLAEWQNTYHLDVHSFQATDSALWVDPASGDYRLKSDSPARDAGTELLTVSEDITGMSRPQGGAYDIGCYEYEVEGLHALAVTTTSLPSCDQGIQYSASLTAGGGMSPYSWEITSGSLPSGLALNGGSGIIAGSTTSAGTYNFTARVTDSEVPSQTATAALSLVVTHTVHATFKDSYNSYTGTRDTWITEDYPNTAVGGPSDTIHLQYPTQDRELFKWDISAIPAGATITSATVTIFPYTLQSGTPTVNCFRVITHWDEMQATFNSRLTGTPWGAPGMLSGTDYDSAILGAKVITSSDPIAFDITDVVQEWVNATAPNEGVMYKLVNSGWVRIYTREVDPQYWAHPQLDVIYTPSGYAAPLALTTAILPDAYVDAGYSEALSASGGTAPYAWSILSGDLPSGLSLDASTGVISGTPSAPGVASFTVRLTDSAAPAGTDDKALTITIIPQPPTITTSSLPNGRIGYSYNQTLAATGGTAPYTWSVSAGALPAGLSLGASTGVINGTPTAASTGGFTVMITDSGAPAATGTRGLSITVPAALSISTSSLPIAPPGVGYSQTVVAVGGVGPYVFAITSGTLPAGLSLNTSDGVISGTPTIMGQSFFTIRATDAQTPADTATKALSIAVAPPGPTYQFAASDTETSTTNTNYTGKVAVTFTPPAVDDWIIFGFCEFKCPNPAYATFVQLFIDGAGEGQNTRKPVDPTDYLPFITVKVKNLTAASHTIQLMYRAGSSSAAAYIRNARICAVRKAALEFYNAAYDNAKPLTINSTDIAVLTWTPATTGNYLVISTAELNATTTVSTDLQTLYNDVLNDEGIMRAADNGDYTTFMSFNYCANAPAGVPITHKITGRKMATDPINHYIRRARILALRLSQGRFRDTAAGYGTERNTTQTTFQEALTTTWTSGANGKWLFLNSARLNNSSTSYQTEVRVQLNNTNTCGQQLMRPKDTTDLLNYSSMDVRNLTTPRMVDMDWRTTNSAGTAKVKRLRFYGLPLDTP